MKKVLLIEDTDEIRENIAEILELNHYQIFAAVNGQDGRDLAEKHQPDVIVCDIKMPKMNGFELIEALHTDEVMKEIPFIFISASAQKKDLEKGKLSGAFAYLTKPFSADDLIRTIEMAIQSSKMSLENRS